VLLDFGTTGCQFQDKIFSNFNYSGTNANLVTATQVFTVVGSQDIHGWVFARQGLWTNGFTLSFVISVAPQNPGTTIVVSKDQLNTGFLPNGITAIDTQSVGTLQMSGTLDQFGHSQEGAQINYAPVQSVATHLVVSGVTAAQGLVSVEQDFAEQFLNATGCPATIGFWKNSKKHPFPADVQQNGLTLLGTHYTAPQIYTILNNNGGNAVVILGRQLIGALLNIAAGAAHSSQADAAIGAAENLLTANNINLTTSYVAPSSVLGQQMIALANILDQYNNANFGTCSEGTGLQLGPA
jgi:hypothetical protein